MKQIKSALIMFILIMAPLNVTVALDNNNGPLNNTTNITVSDEDLILNKTSSLISKDKYNQLLNALNENKDVRNSLQYQYNITNEYKYYISYVDAGYAVRTFANLIKNHNLTDLEVNLLITTLKANNVYYSTGFSPNNSYCAVSFSSKVPDNSTLKIYSPGFYSNLPFVYYHARGLALSPIASANWANYYFNKGDNDTATQILAELSQYLTIGNYDNTEYGLFNIYFELIDKESNVPWVSSYSQGMLSGLYAEAYNRTYNPSYLDTSKLLFNSFSLPLNNSGFVTQTKFGTWFLMFNQDPTHLVLNAHLMTLKGIYNYYNVTGDEHALQLFNEGVGSTRIALPYFDSGNWSYIYETPGWEAPLEYHELHIDLLVWLSYVTNDNYFFDYARQWKVYLSNKQNNLNNI